MWSHDAKDAAQTVQRLNHAGEERGVAAVARKNLPDSEFETTDEILGLLAVLVVHSVLLCHRYFVITTGALELNVSYCTFQDPFTFFHTTKYFASCFT